MHNVTYTVYVELIEIDIHKNFIFQLICCKFYFIVYTSWQSIHKNFIFQFAVNFILIETRTLIIQCLVTIMITFLIELNVRKIFKCHLQ